MSNPQMTTEPALIRTVEEISMNALPALHTLHADGWVLRFADGYTRRANAVYALYPPLGELDDLIRFCETAYGSQGLKTTFKMTAAVCPPDLDAILAARGYQTDARTSVQLLDLTAWAGRPTPEVILSETLNAEWLSGYCRMNAVDDRKRTTMERVLPTILPEHRFASIIADGQTIACGLGVLQDGWIGFFDITTDAAFRKRGHAYRLIESLLVWATQQGARRAYLQVMSNNPPALALYEKLGFREAYQYWYRAKA